MAVTRICIDIAGEGSYDYRIGEHCSDAVGEKLRLISSLADCNRMLLLTDSNVSPYYAAPVKESLSSAGFLVDQIVIPAGEKSKDASVAIEIWSAMSQLGMNRESAVCALGGGVVGDLAGFVAATYMRGIPVVHIPTSLLAMVDSSIGGKAAIDLPEGKNLVGAFHQPAAVFADPLFLSTLPSGQFRCGLAEVVKCALLSEDDFYFWLDDQFPPDAEATELLLRESLHEIIVRTVVFKSGIVAQDPFEKNNLRSILNLGHTYGHALEKCTGYGRYSHGECVAEGIRFASRVAEAELGASPELSSSIDALLDRIGLRRLEDPVDSDSMLAAMVGDKKNGRGGIRFVLMRDLGKPELCVIDCDLVREYIDVWKEMLR